MQMPKPTDEEKERFREVVPAGPAVEVKPMFGNLGAFVNGNMFAGLFGSSLGVKLSETDLTELREVEGSHPFGPEERPMGGFLAVPDTWTAHPDQAAPWLEKAMAHVSTLPPKAKKPARKRSGG